LSDRRSLHVPEHRRALILEHIRLHGSASIQSLSETIGISGSTVRRDLEQLELKGYLLRTHGGAMLQRTQQSTFEPEPAVAARLARTQKQAIGMHAAALLKPGESVVLDSGSTVAAAAAALVERMIPLTAVTNDLDVAHLLSRSTQVKVVIVGGTVRPGTSTITGEPGQEFFKSIHADLAFVGTHAISAEGLTETSLEVAAMKRALIAAARRVVLLADGSKFQPAAFCRICPIEQIHALVTDESAPAEALDDLTARGIDVTIVPIPAG
jgi:DeoR family transcriptional regulator, aga operon transcriptional repressor